MKYLRETLSKTSDIAQDASYLFRDLPHPACAPFALAAFAGITLTAFGAFLVTDTGCAILSELRRRKRLREPRPESPSLRGTPTPRELAADAAAMPRTLTTRLRLGSCLADLEPTLDSGPVYDISPTGARRIAARGRGIRGWMADNHLSLNYSTLMRYKTLAVRLRRLLSLDARLPLEWLLPGAVPDRDISSDLLPHYHATRRRLDRLLREHWNFSRLKQHVETKLGIPRLLTVRRNARRAAQSARARRLMAAPRKPIHCESVVLNNRSVRLDKSLAEATKRELILFLRTPDLPPKLDKLRRRTIDWLNEAIPSPDGKPY